MQPHGSWQLPTEHDWSIFNGSLEGVQDSHFDSIDGGLCWLWDTTWNGIDR